MGPEQTVCRFRCNYVDEGRVVLNPVYDPDPNGVNHHFWTATPSGSLSMWINNPAALAQFAVGQDYDIIIRLTAPQGAEG